MLSSAVLEITHVSASFWPTTKANELPTTATTSAFKELGQLQITSGCSFVLVNTSNPYTASYCHKTCIPFACLSLSPDSYCHKGYNNTTQILNPYIASYCHKG